MENIPISTDYSFDSISCPSVPRRSSSYHYLAEEKPSNFPNLARPGQNPFPSPPSEQNLTPRVQASKARDAFPFPMQPAKIEPPTPEGNTNYMGRPHQAKRRCTGVESSYLTPPSSPDRFVRARLPEDLHRKSYSLSKPPDQLSFAERLLRHNSTTPDPFSPRGRHQFVVSARSPRDGSTTRTLDSSSPDVAIQIPGLRSDSVGLQARRPSAGAVWNVGGTMLGPAIGVPNGRGGLLGSGTNAPMYTSTFFEKETQHQSLERFEGRVAAALNIDQTSRIFETSRPPDRGRSRTISGNGRQRIRSPTTIWRDGQWMNDDFSPILDAPQLRDDFYCSVLAFCHTSRTLAVGLHNRVYLWSEETGVQYPRMEENRQNTYVTSLSFSSTQGGSSILAIGRNSGQISLWSLFDESDRFQSQQPNAVACLSFKPVTTRRESEHLGTIVSTEELLVGDEVGVVYYYSIEWGSAPGDQRWHGAMHLMAKIDVHTQQICGLAWSPEGDYFATGGNDNVCCLFETRDVLTPPPLPLVSGPLNALMTGFIPNFVPNAPTHETLGSMLGSGNHHRNMLPGGIIRPFRSTYLPGQGGLMLNITEGRQRHKWLHSAAVKAIAFCPWQRGLVATGGGSNDRAIHFFHAHSGACLATIAVQAQVTSLIWSTTRREIAATFGYAQPEHPYRIAVFSWPDCRQVVAIPWIGDIRALYAIPYPGGPNETTRQRIEGGRWWSRTAEEGCIVVASSDESVKFHEVWSEARKSTGGHAGLLGGSDILESLEGIDKDGVDVIR
ncbi:hypothetical protein MMC17_007135 [Xylographa soralifera]|nr:hypothetical protein [Xylographa soralifera]